MPRYELVEGTSNKFWEIALEGASFTTTFGRIGTDGQTSTKEFASPAEAKKAYDKLVAEKVKKGYSLASDGDADEDEDVDGEEDAAPILDEAREPALEAAILARPDDPQGYLVYGDWLSSKGEPRGELIAIQHALRVSPGMKELEKAAAAILKKHKAKLLGPLAAHLKTHDGENQESFSWQLGFIRSARFAWDHYANEEQEVDLAELVRTLLQHPSGRLLQELTIGLNRADPDCEYGPILAVLGELGSKSLRTLFVADFEYPDQIEMSWTNLGSFAPIWGALPNLEKLIVQGSAMQLGEIAAPKLRHFEIRTGGLPSEIAQSIASAQWPELETLLVWTGSEDYEGTTTLEDLAPILEARGLPKLRHLGIMNCQFTDALCAALAASKILPQLETLDLSMGTMGAEGRAALLAAAPAFKHLKKLDLENNCLEDTSGLETLCAEVVIGAQRADEGDEGERYVMVGE